MNRTQLRFSVVVLVLCFVGGMTSASYAQFGVGAGLNFDSVSDIDTNTNQNTSVENSTGYHVGIVYETGFGPVKLRPGVFYRELGTTYQFPQSPSNVTAWEVPVDLRFTLMPTPLVSPYIVGGPKASFMQSDVQEFEDDGLEDVAYSFTVGLGAELTLGSLPKLQPELRYDFGATDYIEDDFEIGDTEFEAEDPTLSSFALRLNVIF